jgi:hypothetical protein
MFACFFYFYFAELDSNAIGVEGEVDFEVFKEVQGQISQGKPSFDLLRFILLVVFVVPLYTWFLVSCVMIGPLHYAYLLPSMLNPLLILCMLTLSMYAPLTTYIIIFLVV